MTNVDDPQLKKEIESIKDNIEVIDSRRIIEEPVLKSLKHTAHSKERNFHRELLEETRAKTMKNFLTYIKGKNMKEAQKELTNQINEYDKNVQSILIKSDIEVKQYKSQYEKMFEEKKNLEDKFQTLQEYNKELLEEVQSLQLNLVTIQRNYETLSQQKNIFEDLIREFPGNTPSEVITEIQTAKKGAADMLKDYEKLSYDFQEMKSKIQKSEIKYKEKINFLSSAYKDYIDDKKMIEDTSKQKINSLEQLLLDTESKVKENQNLRNTLHHIYILLFEEFGLNRNIKMDNKFFNITETDFNPNIFYQPEIRNYIKLMVTTMHPSTYDLLFRESIGLLNLILRTYIPSKKDLRFQPVKALQEIKIFIDSKIKIIEDNKKLIESVKQEKENSEMKAFKIQQEYNLLTKEYEYYRKIVEKELEKSNKTIYGLKNSKNKKDFINNTTSNIKAVNSLNKSINKKVVREIIDSEKKIDVIPKNKFEKITVKTEENEKLEKEKSGNEIKYDIKKKNEINNRNFYNLKPSVNKDKILRSHGSQETVDNISNINFLINETNRLYLYRPRMNSIQNKDKFFGGNEAEFVKNKSINKFNERTLKNHLLNENGIKKRIFNKLNKLISSANTDDIYS